VLDRGSAACNLPIHVRRTAPSIRVLVSRPPKRAGKAPTRILAAFLKENQPCLIKQYRIAFAGKGQRLWAIP